jgi:uncharacterized protein YjbJ (UPF0337 family)
VRLERQLAQKVPAGRPAPLLVSPGTLGMGETLDPHHASGRETTMDWNRIEGNWKQFKGKVKEKWGRLTDDDLDIIAGHRDQLEGKIQERYGIARDQVRKDIDDWFGAQKW